MKLEKEFEVKVKRTSRRRTVSLEVREGFVQIIVPNALSEKEIEINYLETDSKGLWQGF